MRKPYIICHMMMAVDGRIDCGMTSKLNGVEEYYQTLDELNTPTTLSGRTTAQLEMAEPGVFEAENRDCYGREAFSKKTDASGYEVVVDTRGTLLWQDQTGSDKPLLVITSEQVTKEYLQYLDTLNISWIVSGREHIDIARAVEILAEQFGVGRMAIVGGGTINGGFLAEDLLDEISILLAPGIDGRKGMAAVFDGLPMDTEPFQLKLKNVEQYGDGAVWLRYTVAK